MNPFHVHDYRPEVDGLRALAVLSVILFHAGFQLFPGGFVGVDVFFVISGFLITGLIIKDKEQGTFSLQNFYARRARRIGPALAVVLVVCLLLVFLLMAPARQLEYSELMTAVSLFYSNYLLATTTGYFNGAADEKILLHTWSLAVEEQYYFVFPLAVHLLWRFWRGKLPLLLLSAVAIASFAWCEYEWHYHQEQNFFLTSGRIWELMLGSIAAWLSIRKGDCLYAMSMPLQYLLGLLGLFAIVGAVLFFDAHTPTPSLYSLAPTLGAALVLLYARGNAPTARLLAAKPLVWTGLVSYSAYLWHQPLFAMARMMSLGPLSPVACLGLVVLTFALAHLTWKFVERPVRLLKAASPSRTLFVALACTLILAILGEVGQQISGERNGEVPGSVVRSFQPPARYKECFDIDYAHSTKAHWYCDINADPRLQTDFMLFGDSHALQLLDAFDLAARHVGRRGQIAGFSGCIPLLGVYQLTRPDQSLHDCHALNARILAHVRDSGIKDVFLVAKWSYYTEYWNGTRYINAIGIERTTPASIDNTRKAFEWAVTNTVQSYAKWGVRLHVIEQIPQQLYQPETVYQNAWKDSSRVDDFLRKSSVSLEQHRQLQAFPNLVFSKAQSTGGLTVNNFDNIYCDLDKCLIGTANTPYYRDLSHLSAQGAFLMVPALEKMLAANSDASPINMPSR